MIFLKPKNNIVLIICFSTLLFSSYIKAQTLPADKNINGLTITTGTSVISNNTGIVSPSDNSNVSISGNAQIDYKAGTKIQLHPGFKASSFTGSGKFHAYISPGDFSVMEMQELYAGASEIPRFEKLEYGIEMPATVKALVDAYFVNKTDPTAINPFDPEDINIEATFTTPGGAPKVIYGFYMDDYTTSGANWISANNDYKFRVRFAPWVIGNWTCFITINSPNNKFSGSYSTTGLNFKCIPSGNPGYLEVGHHKRQLRFSASQESFFAIGQNIPWPHHGNIPYTNTYDEARNRDNVFEAGEFAEHYDNVKDLGEKDGNYVRIIMAPFGHCIEWENLGDYSDYNSYAAGIPQTRQHNAYELDKIFELCHEKNVYIDLDLELQDTHKFKEDSNFSWDKNPYHSITGVNVPMDMLTNTVAIKYFERRLRYIMARWGYSTNLAVIELLSEQDGWEGWNAANVTYRTAMLNWHGVMATYIKDVLEERNHLIGTSFHERQPSLLSPFNLASIDVTANNKYELARQDNLDRFKKMNSHDNDNGSKGLLVDYDKPSIFTEIGLDTRLSDDGVNMVDQGDIEGCDDICFHNDMWATAFMGGYGAGINWWQDYNSDYRSNFGPIATFFNIVDFSTGKHNIFETNKFYPERWKERIPSFNQKNYRFEVFSLHNYSKSKVMGWAHNATYYWGNIVQAGSSCIDRYSNQMREPDDDDGDFDAPQAYIHEKVQIEGLQIMEWYALDWFNTRGTSTATPIHSVFWKTNILGHLKPYMPGGADFAFKATKIGTSGFREELPEDNFQSDTLYCGQDTIQINGSYGDDTLGIYHYSWDFGNGQISSEPYPTVIYEHPGTYNVVLIVTADTLHSTPDTLQQQLVVLACDTSEVNRFVLYHPIEKNTTIFKDIAISPNPTNGQFLIEISKEHKAIGIEKIEIYDFLGRIVWSTGHSENNQLIINIDFCSEGIYYIRVINSDGDLSINKLIKK